MSKIKVPKKKLIPFPKMLKKAESVFNKFIRERDKEKGCISCGNPVTQAGHYFPVHGFSALRFHEYNVNGQCAGCNCFRYGNQAMYRIGLAIRIGNPAVEELEQKAIGNPVYKWSRSELEEIINKYA